MTEDTHTKHLSEDARQNHGARWLGILLAVVGFFWFAKKVNWMPGDSSGPEIFWPVVTMVFASFLIFGSRGRRDRPEENSEVTIEKLKAR